MHQKQPPAKAALSNPPPPFLLSAAPAKGVEPANIHVKTIKAIALKATIERFSMAAILILPERITGVRNLYGAP